MPKSPLVNFVIENNNVESSVPLTGVSCLLARTKKGPYNDPSTLITSVSQFQSIFGGEVVPDGSPSNIEKALSKGSKLRIIRVPGTGYFKGVVLNTSTDSGTAPTTQQTPKAILKIGQGTDLVEIGFYTKTGDDLVDGVRTFDVNFYKKANTLYYSINATGKTTVLESNPVITLKPVSTNNSNVVDYLAFNNFLNNSEYLEPYVVSSTIEGDGSVASIIKWMAEVLDGSTAAITFTVVETAFASLNTTLSVISQVGSSGTAPTKTAWIDSMEYLLNYTDVYQVACSHLDQHLTAPADVLEVHKAFRDTCEKVQEYTYYIEVPKYKTHFTEGTDVRDKDSIISWVDTCINTIGNSMWVAYFAGGLKYYNNSGIVVNSDILGTVIGLGDASASQAGVWKSFAGMNRGVIEDAHGSVSPNYGSPARYDDLDALATSYVNLAVVKKTRSMGTRTMLWHCFTSQIKQDSFKFLSIVRLVLYMKKNLRPILDSYLEEPNTFQTWNNIYLEVKPILDQLVNKEAITEYNWEGDQHASSYADLVVNNEADVRQGKYKAVLRFKEIVPLQEISMVLSIDKASSSVSTEINS